MSSTVFFWQGSPPRGRGKVLQVAPLCAEPGITPAWAGKSPKFDDVKQHYEDHPRACGEKNKELEGVWLPMGSPPHGRGKGQDTLYVRDRYRITPA